MVGKIIIEAIIYSVIYGCFLVTLILKQGALKQLYNYPPKIRERVLSLGLTTKEEMAADARKWKPLGFAVMIVLNLVLICAVNGEKTFWAGLWQSYIFLNTWSLCDAALIDSVWFCNTKYFILPGTEDMTAEYRDYWFHWKYFFIGLVSLLPMAAVIGGLTALIGLIDGIR